MKQLILFLKISPLLLLILSVLIWYFSTHVAPYMILSPQKINEALRPDDLGLTSKKVEIVSIDSLVLRGYHILPEGPEMGTVIFIHGIGGCKEHFLHLSQQLSEIGIASLVFDLRAHGESDGQFCTYGYHEKKDVSLIVDYLIGRNSNQRIGVWGNSLGGAIAIQALEYDKRISFGIVESTFTELDLIVSDYQKRFTGGLGSKSLTDYVLNQAGRIADFIPAEVKPVVSAKMISQPVLIAHGDSDDNISVEYGKSLYNALKTPDKELIIVAGGEHFGLFETGGQAYQDQLFGFLKEQMR